jgi:ABC-type Fe3+-hydroxamate transport system substrate-binding protein
MPEYVDQLGRTVELKQVPIRIISLVPSQTELLFELGLDEEVIGITKFCVHPEQWFNTKTRVGGTKQLHLEKIKELQPDLIIANKEENVQSQIEELAKEFPVWVSDVEDLDDALRMIVDVGEIVNRKDEAIGFSTSIAKGFADLHSSLKKNFSTLYLIWKDPYMTIGGDTFINDMLERSGFRNAFHDWARYPQIGIEQIEKIECELIFLSSEPFPFKQKHVDELQPLLPDTKICLVDGEMFSWYGSRLLKAPAYFKQLQNQLLSLTHARGTE